MQALFERMKVPSEMMELYIEQSLTLSIECLATLNENNSDELNHLVKLGFNHLTAYTMIKVSKKIQGSFEKTTCTIICLPKMKELLIF